jgi:membrane-associated protein
VDEWLDGGPEGSLPPRTGASPLLAPAPAEAEPGK